jgi:hypothetical protein
MFMYSDGLCRWWWFVWKNCKIKRDRNSIHGGLDSWLVCVDGTCNESHSWEKNPSSWSQNLEYFSY